MSNRFGNESIREVSAAILSEIRFNSACYAVML